MQHVSIRHLRVEGQLLIDLGVLEVKKGVELLYCKHSE